MSTVRIVNPVLSLLPPDLLHGLSGCGFLRRLAHGKFKGFRIEYHESKDYTRETIFSILYMFGAVPVRYAEHVVYEKRYINIHELEVQEDSKIFLTYNLPQKQEAIQTTLDVI